MSEPSLRDPEALFAVLTERLFDQPFWLRRVHQCFGETGSTRMHLAVFREPFLALVLTGKKTIESRFSINRLPPYECAGSGDLILLKRTAGPVVGIALAGAPGFYQLDAAAWKTIRSRFAAAICASDAQFWAQRSRARYGTLIPIRATTSFAPFPINKHDRRGWAIIDSTPLRQTTLTKINQA